MKKTIEQLEADIEKQKREIRAIEDGERKPEIKDKKHWWYGFFIKDRLKKPNKVAVLFLRNNNNAELIEAEPKDGFFYINNEAYHEDRDCVYTVSKDRIPLVIISEWDIIPLGTKSWYDQPLRKKFSELERHVLKGIRNAELVKTLGGRGDHKLTTKQIIVYGLAALVAIAVFLNYS